MRFTARYEQLLDTMDSLIEDSHDPELQGIRTSMTKKDLVAMILVLSDILKPVNMLSLYLQGDCGVFADLPAKVQGCREHLEDVIQRYQQGNLEDLEYRY